MKEKTPPKHIISDNMLHTIANKYHIPLEEIQSMAHAIQNGVNTFAEYTGFNKQSLDVIEHTALSQYQAGMYEKSSQCYIVLLQLAPNRMSAWRGLGACRQALKNYQKAINCYDKALTYDMQDPITNFFKGECLCFMGEKTEGITYLQQCIDFAQQQIISKKRQEYYLKPYIERAGHIIANIGNLVTKAPQQDAAPQQDKHEIFQHVIDQSHDIINQKNPIDNPFSDPKFKQDIDKITQLVETKQITLKDVAGFTKAQMDGGYAAVAKLLDAKKYAEALQTLAMLMFLDPKDARFYQIAGVCLQHLKAYCFADYMYTVALIYDQDNPISTIYLGEVKIMCGRHNEGLTLLQKGLALCGAITNHNKDMFAASKRAHTLIRLYKNIDNKKNKEAPHAT